MYELIRISENDYYVDCPAKIGLVRVRGNEVIAIDSGSDKDAAKKVLKHIDGNGWKLVAVLNTHSHADHIGGNRLLQERTGCRIFARGIEASFANAPILEPVSLYGGYPFKELRHKFLMAQESHVELLTADALPEGMEMIELPGHSFDMVGFRTADGSVFLGDSVCSEETLEKYAVTYVWNVEAYLNSLETVKGLRAARFVPSHAPMTEDIADLTQRNIDAVARVAERIMALCASPTSFEALLAAMFEAYGISMNAQQYALIGSTVRGYLAWLRDSGRMDFIFENNRMLWQTVNRD